MIRAFCAGVPEFAVEFEVARVNGFELLCGRRVFDGHSQVGSDGGREPQNVGPGAREGSGTDDCDGNGQSARSLGWSVWSNWC